jgi:hypothetical protein
MFFALLSAEGISMLNGYLRHYYFHKGTNMDNGKSIKLVFGMVLIAAHAALTHAMETPPQDGKKIITTSPEDWQRCQKIIDALDHSACQLYQPGIETIDLASNSLYRFDFLADEHLDSNPMLAAIINKSILDIKKADDLRRENDAKK